MVTLATFGNAKQTNKFPSISWNNLSGILDKDSSSGGGFVTGNAATSKSVSVGGVYTTEDIIVRSPVDTGSSFVLRRVSVETNARAQVQPLNGTTVTAEIVFTLLSKDPRTNGKWLGNILLGQNFTVSRATFNPNIQAFGLESGTEIAITVRAPSSFTTSIDFISLEAEFEFTGGVGNLTPQTISILINDVNTLSQANEIITQDIIIEQGVLTTQQGPFVVLDELDIDILIEDVGTNIVETGSITQSDIIIQLGEWIAIGGIFGLLSELDITVSQNDVTTVEDTREILSDQEIQIEQGDFILVDGPFGALTGLDITISPGVISSIDPSSVMDAPPDFDPNDPDSVAAYASAITNSFTIIVDSDTIGLTIFDDGITYTNDWMLWSNVPGPFPINLPAESTALFNDSALEIWMDWDAGFSSGTFDSFPIVTTNTASEFENSPFGGQLEFDADIRYSDIPALGDGGPWMSWHNHPRPFFKDITTANSADAVFDSLVGPGEGWFEPETYNIVDFIIETQNEATHDPNQVSQSELSFFSDIRFSDVPVSADNPNLWMSWINQPKYANVNIELLGTSAITSTASFEVTWMGWEGSQTNIIINTTNTAVENTSAENFNILEFKTDIDYTGIPINLSAISPSASTWMIWDNQPQTFGMVIQISDEGVSDPNQPTGPTIDFRFDIDFDGVPVSADQFEPWMAWDNQPQGFPINIITSNTAEFGFPATFVSSVWANWDGSEDSSSFILTQFPVFESYDMELLGNDQFLTVYTLSSALRSIGVKVSGSTIDITTETNSSPRGISPYILTTDVPSIGVIGFFDITAGVNFNPTYNFISYGVSLSNLTSITTVSSTTDVNSFKRGVNTSPTRAFEYRIFDNQAHRRSLEINGNAETITILGQTVETIEENIIDIERVGNTNAAIKFTNQSNTIHRGSANNTAAALSSFSTNVPDVSSFVNVDQNDAFFAVFQDSLNNAILKYKRFDNSSSTFVEVSETEIVNNISFGAITQLESIQLDSYAFMVFARTTASDIYSMVFTTDTDLLVINQTTNWIKVAENAQNTKMIARKKVLENKISLIFKHTSDHLAIKIISL